MKREFIDYVKDILESVDNLTKFIGDMNYDAFAADSKTVYAVVRALEIIGEATKKIPASIQEKYPNIPWKEMAGMRDKLIHEYFGIILKVVWDTVKQDITPLKPMFENILHEEDSI